MTTSQQRYVMQHSTLNILIFLLFQTCFDKEKVLGTETNQIINLTSNYQWSGCEVGFFYSIIKIYVGEILTPYI